MVVASSLSEIQLESIVERIGPPLASSAEWDCEHPMEPNDPLTSYSLYLFLKNNDVSVSDSVWDRLWLSLGLVVGVAVHHVHYLTVRKRGAEFGRNHLFQKAEGLINRGSDHLIPCIDRDVSASEVNEWGDMNECETRLSGRD